MFKKIPKKDSDVVEMSRKNVCEPEGNGSLDERNGFEHKGAEPSPPNPIKAPRPRFELGSRARQARMIGRYTTGAGGLGKR